MADTENANLSAPPAPVPLRYEPRRSSRLSRTRSRIREFFRPDHLREFLSTLALVAPLTVLVWVWAEREQAVEVPVKKSFAIAVRASNVTKTVALAQGESDSVLVEMNGPRAGVEAIKDAIAKDPDKGRLVIDVGDIYEPGGPNTLVLDSLLDQQKLFVEHGVKITSTEPAKVAVVVDRQIEREVPVRLPVEIADGVQSSSFEPKTVKVRGPERVIKQLEANGGLRAELDLSNLAELRSRGGLKPIELAAVPLKPVEGTGVTFDVPKVSKVTLQLS